MVSLVVLAETGRRGWKEADVEEMAGMVPVGVAVVVVGYQGGVD